MGFLQSELMSCALVRLVPQPHYNTHTMQGFKVPGWLGNCWALSTISSANPIKLGSVMEE